jgi:hypothetical protein
MELLSCPDHRTILDSREIRLSSFSNTNLIKVLFMAPSSYTSSKSKFWYNSCWLIPEYMMKYAKNTLLGYCSTSLSNFGWPINIFDYSKFVMRYYILIAVHHTNHCWKPDECLSLSFFSFQLMIWRVLFTMVDCILGFVRTRSIKLLL